MTAKVIRVAGPNLGPYNRKIVRTPGVTGYAARFIASHVQQPEGSTLAEWASVGGSVPTVLKPLAGGVPSLKLGAENGVVHVHSGGAAAAGGRLLGTHVNQRPITFAGVFKVGPGTERFAGVGGATLTRNTSGYYISNGGAYTQVQRDGWIFLLITVAVDGSVTLRADNAENSRPAGAVPQPANYAGAYIGADEVGDATQVREMIYWPRGLSLAERDAVHAYYRAQYQDIS